MTPANEIITARVVMWKYLSTFSRSVLEQLVDVSLSISGIDLLGVMYRRFLSIHEKFREISASSNA